ncbi:DJ-1/PfpI family protein [Bacillus sp. FJAT-49732]|uniref:DJ-1/PfpI family protein n=1 Tax=Lederbergia citrisecunda TaxID=2833583 RepID=A0A942YLZ4_9BACI|nr:DJ-1/PfpI family protein [Lederbergia citrisecunda]MBS4201167.1 DJ-1/PfpI family protein [Lederbergia citrisecunda]
MTRKKALLFIFEGYCEFEIAVAISMLRNSHDVDTFGLEKKAIKSEAGLTTLPDFTIDELVIEKYDVLIIPGGDLRPIVEFESNRLYDITKEFVEAGKVTAAICSGVYVLAKAGVLTEVPYTVTLAKEQRNFLGCFQEDHYCYQSTVRNKNILTAQGHAFVSFGIELCKMVKDVSHEAVEFYRGMGNKMMEEGLSIELSKK